MKNEEMENDNIFVEKINDFSCPEAEKKFKELTKMNFFDFYNQYKPKLEWTLYKMYQDKEECSDVATDAFIRALYKIDQFNPQYKFSTWLFTIAKRLMLERIKNKKHFVSIEQEIDEDFTINDILVDNTERKTGILEEKKAEILKEKIYGLKDKFRTVMIMRELNNQSYVEISKKLGENLSTIKSRIRNSRILLRNQVEKEFKKLEEIYQDDEFLS